MGSIVYFRVIFNLLSYQVTSNYSSYLVWVIWRRLSAQTTLGNAYNFVSGSLPRWHWGTPVLGRVIQSFFKKINNGVLNFYAYWSKNPCDIIFFWKNWCLPGGNGGQNFEKCHIKLNFQNYGRMVVDSLKRSSRRVEKDNI